MPGGSGLTGVVVLGNSEELTQPGCRLGVPQVGRIAGGGDETRARGGVAAQKAPYDNSEYTTKYPWMAQVKDLVATGKGLPGVTKQAQLVEIMGRHLSEAVAGGASPQEAMDAAAEEISELL